MDSKKRKVVQRRQELKRKKHWRRMQLNAGRITDVFRFRASSKDAAGVTSSFRKRDKYHGL